MLSFEEIEIDVLDLYFFEVEGNTGSPGSGTLSKGVKLIHSQDIIDFQYLRLQILKCKNHGLSYLPNFYCFSGMGLLFS